MTPVTKPYLPSREKLNKYIDRIYDSAWLTNRGPILQDLETRLCDYLEVENLVLVANGSLALQLAYKALELSGEVITTPFTFLATSSTLVWENLTPVFADISKANLNIDTDGLEELVTDRTSAIVPVHVYGNPCDVDAIGSFATKHGLKVIYDAAHAFGVKYDGESILRHGDICTLSFHATKIFHTIEGGAVVTRDRKVADKVRKLINFGLSDPQTIVAAGTNAKLNEFEAAMGMAVLDDINLILEQRRAIWEYYASRLPTNLILPTWNQSATRNFSYFPVIFPNESQLVRSKSRLEAEGYMTRRYFYPSLDSVKVLRGRESHCPVSNEISRRVLCLPIFPGLTQREQDGLLKVLKESLYETP